MWSEANVEIYFVPPWVPVQTIMGCTHKVIAVIIPALTSDSHLKLIVTSFTRSLQEVFWEKLTLFIVIVTSSLHPSNIKW